MLKLDSGWLTGLPVGRGNAPVPPVSVVFGKNDEPVPVPGGKATTVPLPVRAAEDTMHVALASGNVRKLDTVSY